MSQSQLRTQEQHLTEWLYYSIIADVSGMLPYDVYMAMSIKFLKCKDYDGDDAVIRTSSLSIREHYNYLQNIIVYMAEFGFILPEPTLDIKAQYKFKKIKYGK